MLRTLISILLLVAFGLPFASPLLASTGDADANVPICCRRNGKHHCLMNMAGRDTEGKTGAQFQAPVDRCPYCPGAVAGVHTDLLSPAAAAKSFAPLASHPAGVAQTESRWRIARDRSRQKRGPPAPLFS